MVSWQSAIKPFGVSTNVIREFRLGELLQYFAVKVDVARYGA